MPNKNPIFAGRTPIAYMIDGGTPAFAVVWRMLDAIKHGV